MDLTDFLPVRDDDVNAVLARMFADLNAGLDPDDDRWVDTTEGGFAHDLLMVYALEAERLWDFAATEVVAAAMPSFGWGEYLDGWAEVLGLERKPAVAASGEVTFAGTDGTLIPPGTQVAVPSLDPEQDLVAYEVTTGGSIAAGVVVLPVRALVEGSAANAPAGTVTLLLSALDEVAPVTNADAVSGGADVESDAELQGRIEVTLASEHGAGNVSDYARWSLAWPGVGHATVTAAWAGPGTVLVVVTDADNRPVGPEVVDGLQNDLDPPSATTLANGAQALPAATVTVDSTAGFRATGQLRTPNGVLSYTGLTGTTFTGVTAGTGTLANNASVVQGAAGRGTAPIGATVTVTTPTAVTVDVAAVVLHEAGYSLDGASDTRATRAEVEASVAAYFLTLEAGEDVVLTKLIASVVDVEGVADASGVLIEGVAANFAIAGGELAQTGTIGLT